MFELAAGCSASDVATTIPPIGVLGETISFLRLNKSNDTQTLLGVVKVPLDATIPSTP